MGNRKKAQHYVPQFYLRGFSNVDEEVRVFDLEKESFSGRKISKILFENNLYEVFEGYPNHYENLLSELEAYIAKGYRDFVASFVCENPDRLVRNDFHQVIRLLVLQLVRHPDFMNEQKELFETHFRSGFKSATSEVLSPKQLDGLSKIASFENFSRTLESFNQHFSDQGAQCLILNTATMDVSSRGKGFVTSDFPVIQLTEGKLIKQRVLHPLTDLVIYPLSRSLCFCLGRKQALDTFFNEGVWYYDSILVPIGKDLDCVDLVNVFAIGNANRLALSHPKDSLDLAKAWRALNENMYAKSLSKVYVDTEKKEDIKRQVINVHAGLDASGNLTPFPGYINAAPEEAT